MLRAQKTQTDSQAGLRQKEEEEEEEVEQWNHLPLPSVCFCCDVSQPPQRQEERLLALEVQRVVIGCEDLGKSMMSWKFTYRPKSIGRDRLDRQNAGMAGSSLGHA